MTVMNDQIQTMLESECVDYIGYAAIANHENELVAYGGSIVKGYNFAISVGIALPDAIVDYLPQRDDPNVACEYKNQCYSVVNDRLNAIASRLSSFLNRKGHRTLPLVASERTNEEEAIPTVSHKMIAHIAGLGWIGKSCLLITPDHGPRVRFISVLTNAPLNAVDQPMEQRCNTCMACAKICPTNAIKGVNYRMGGGRDERFDFRKCQDYFSGMQQESAWDVCGLCLYVCPYGRRK